MRRADRETARRPNRQRLSDHHDRWPGSCRQRPDFGRPAIIGQRSQQRIQRNTGGPHRVVTELVERCAVIVADQAIGGVSRADNVVGFEGTRVPRDDRVIEREFAAGQPMEDAAPLAISAGKRDKTADAGRLTLSLT